MKKIARKIADRICDYDEGFTRADAYEIGWCHKCKCSPFCPYKKKTENDMKKVRREYE